MTNRESSIWKNLTIIILGGAGVATWMVGACDSADGLQDGRAPSGAVQHVEASLEVVNQVPAGYALVPGGVVIHKDCIYQVPDGAVTYPDQSVTLNGKKIAQYGPC